jgi:heparan-alpha-glucosaminide N-acetyltransferase
MISSRLKSSGMTGTRLESIDIFRALTMLLMIFVNDLWTLSGIPGWLEHKAAHEDGMGLADVVFPAFLFIVGLSIPLAISARQARDDSKPLILRHIIERTVALLVMGLFMVNLEHTQSSGLLISRYWWQVLMALAFFLIWNDYRGRTFGKLPPVVLKLAGAALLVFLAVIYRGEGGNGYHWMRTYWWGILGLIGWGYLLSALFYLLSGNRPWWVAVCCVVLYLLNVNEFATPFDFSIRIVVSASNYASVATGMLVSVILIRLREKEQMSFLLPLLAGVSAVLLLFGFLTRHLWGISKILATPSWTAICAAISTLSFGLLHVLADRLKLTGWAAVVAPAGYSTLTCYLVPYFVYAFAAMSGLHLPGVLTTGLTGLFKSLVFSVLIIQLTGLMGKLNIRLKI